MIHTLPAWFELVSLAFCTGAVVCRMWIFPSSADGGHASCERTRSRLWGLFGAAAGIMMFFTIIDLFVRAVEMSGAPPEAVFPVLPIVLFQTHYGAVWIARITAEILLLILWKFVGRCGVSRTYLSLALVLTVVISATESASGHAADKGDFTLTEIADFFHLLATSFWGGGLLVLAVFLLPDILRLDDDHAAPVLAGVARRFSRAAGLAVGVVGITALYNGLSYVGTLDALWGTYYGKAVTAKIILFVILLALGAFNRYVNVPDLQGWAGSPAGGGITGLVRRLMPQSLQNINGRDVASRFRRSVRFEALLIVAVLFCAALLRHEVPAKHALHMEHNKGTESHHNMH